MTLNVDYNIIISKVWDTWRCTGLETQLNATREMHVLGLEFRCPNLPDLKGRMTIEGVSEDMDNYFEVRR